MRVSQKIISACALLSLPMFSQAADVVQPAATIPSQGGKDSPWRLSLGISYRHFGHVEANTLSLRNGSLPLFPAGDPNAGPLGVQGYTPAMFSSLALPGQFFTANEAVAIGASDDADTGSSFAPVLGVERRLSMDDNRVISLVGNLQYHHVQSSGSSTPDVAGSQYFYDNLSETFLTVSGATFPDPVPGSLNTASVRSALDMDLFQFDLGLKVATNNANGNFDWYAAAGPTLAIANSDSSLTESASWTNAASGLPESYSQRHSDCGMDVAIGVYGALGVEYRLNKNWSLGLEGRYDHAFEKIGTDLAKLDLSGPSLMLKAIYAF